MMKVLWSPNHQTGDHDHDQINDAGDNVNNQDNDDSDVDGIDDNNQDNQNS